MEIIAWMKEIGIINFNSNRIGCERERENEARNNRGHKKHVLKLVHDSSRHDPLQVSKQQQQVCCLERIHKSHEVLRVYFSELVFILMIFFLHSDSHI